MTEGWSRAGNRGRQVQDEGEENRTAADKGVPTVRFWNMLKVEQLLS